MLLINNFLTYLINFHLAGQAAVRAYRMGQMRPVFVYRLVASGTMEQFVYDRQARMCPIEYKCKIKTLFVRVFDL